MTRVAHASLIAATALVVAACSGARSHPYAGRMFDPARGCLRSPSAIDVVDGTDEGLGCARKCLAGPLPTDGGGRVVYISTACPPYPARYETSGAPLECVDAVAAAEREDFCLEDGGSTKPGPQDAAPGD